MNRWRNLLIALGVSLILGACSTMPPVPPPLTAVPDVGGPLSGTWTGTWGGTPVTLVVVEQTEFAAYSGVYLGPLQLLGQRAPGVSGVLTSTIGGAPVSVNVQGWLGATERGRTLVLTGVALDGVQYLSLARVEDDRLVGRGQSDFRWGPQGPVNLVRQPPR